jgi:hypothetical protein
MLVAGLGIAWGLVAPLESSILGAALVELIEDAALRERLAEQVRAMNFGDESWLSIAEKTRAVYEASGQLSVVSGQ